MSGMTISLVSTSSYVPVHLADACLGGNIKGAVNSPSESFTQNVTELVKQYDEGEFGGTVNPALTDLFPNSAQSCLP
jgi:hypothetical protein